MQELIIDILLAVVAAMAIGLLIWGQTANSNMTKKQKKMLDASWRPPFCC